MTNELSMDPATLEALRGSIAKWEAIVAGTGKDEGHENCPLCRKFHFVGKPEITYAKSCEGCPVYARTGDRLCENTPYAVYATAEEDDLEEEMAQAAEEELEFLKSLLPQEGA